MCRNLGTLKITTYGMVSDRRMVSDPRYGMLCRVLNSRNSEGRSLKLRYWSSDTGHENLVIPDTIPKQVHANSCLSMVSEG